MVDSDEVKEDGTPNLKVATDLDEASKSGDELEGLLMLVL
jgi:hypothetical protein